ncbi:MAG TPA: HlyD family efflux transporter periplasmic adaptor subunit [Acidimicrobiales bacterium]|nr:HlyD family efflux transporter periplasmic adaptor subunit [Acidimicrobiales bacterium]
MWIGNGILVVVVGVLAYFGLTSLFHTASAHSATRTATVQVGTVSQTVTASGNISPAQSQNVNFPTGGTVSTINVSVGQRVTAGQTLATLDPGPAQAALTAAEDNLTAAQDNLSLAQNGNETPPQIQQDNATLSVDQAAVNSAQTTLTADQSQLATYQAECSKSPSGTTSAGATSSGAGGKTGGSTTSPTTTAASTSNPCQLATSEQQTVNQDQNALSQAQNALNQENLALGAKRYANPATILQDEAQVTSAQAAVTQDQKALAGTTLAAPFDGTVTAVNGTLGQTVSGGGNSSAASSGGTSGSSGGGSGSGSGGASAGGSAGGSGSGSGAAASVSSSSSSSSSGSSTGFITLANLASLQVVAGFPEASAVKVKVGQPATVTLSATSSTASGTVTSINPTPSVVSNVVTYQVTVTLQNPPASVQDGMSATVAVVVASASNALELPSSAITTTGRVSTVELLNGGKQVLKPITVGLVGDSTTQILSGLSAGDTVVEPSVTVSGTGTGRTGTGGGLGGLFGGFGGGTGGGAGGGATNGRGG